MKSISKFVLLASLVLASCTEDLDGAPPEDLADAQGEVSGGLQPLHVDFTLTSQITPTSDPCVAHVFEQGTARSPQLGDAAWQSDAVTSFCSRGDGKGDLLATFTFAMPNGDKIFGHMQTVTTLHPDQSLSWIGTWRIVGGTGAYRTARGGGVIPPGGVENVGSPAPFACAFDGFFSL